LGIEFHYQFLPFFVSHTGSTNHQQPYYIEVPEKAQQQHGIAELLNRLDRGREKVEPLTRIGWYS